MDSSNCLRREMWYAAERSLSGSKICNKSKKNTVRWSAVEETKRSEKILSNRVWNAIDINYKVFPVCQFAGSVYYAHEYRFCELLASLHASQKKGIFDELWLIAVSAKTRGRHQALWATRIASRLAGENWIARGLVLNQAFPLEFTQQNWFKVDSKAT